MVCLKIRNVLLYWAEWKAAIDLWNSLPLLFFFFLLRYIGLAGNVMVLNLPEKAAIRCSKFWEFANQEPNANVPEDSPRKTLRRSKEYAKNRAWRFFSLRMWRWSWNIPSILAIKKTEVSRFSEDLVAWIFFPKEYAIVYYVASSKNVELPSKAESGTTVNILPRQDNNWW